MSWDEAFSQHYDEWSAHMTDDVPFYVRLAREADGPVVELAVGDGRVAIPVAQAIRRSVIGVDMSPSMLERAMARAAEAGVELDLRLGDMREFRLDEQAALIYCPFRSLLHLATWADRRRTFERVAMSLRPGGRLHLIDVAGLELESLDGGFDGEPLTDDSREYVFVARRREPG